MNKGNLDFKPEILVLRTVAEAKAAISEIGADPYGVENMSLKALHRVVKLKNVSTKAANILKQEMLAKGGEAAVARDTVSCKAPQTDVLLMGTLRQYAALIEKLKLQPFGLRAIADALQEVLAESAGAATKVWTCGRYRLPIGKKTYIMGILNVTPDSFSDGGMYQTLDCAVAHARAMVAAGADIIDVGGESTRPGAAPVTAAEELARVIPVVEYLAQELTVPISIDTYKAEVAAAAVKAGASIINDVWGLQADPRMAEVVAQSGAGIVIMHNQQGTNYNHLINDILSFLQSSIAMGLAQGIQTTQIVIDPGFGFGKNAEQNLELMHNLYEFKCLGYPLLLGTSRKSTIGKVLGLPVEQRVEGTAATVAMGIVYGAEIVRVHDVREMSLVAKMTDAMYRR